LDEAVKIEEFRKNIKLQELFKFKKWNDNIKSFSEIYNKISLFLKFLLL
jgi:hypothetical protein